MSTDAVAVILKAEGGLLGRLEAEVDGARGSGGANGVGAKLKGSKRELAGRGPRAESIIGLVAAAAPRAVSSIEPMEGLPLADSGGCSPDAAADITSVSGQ